MKKFTEYKQLNLNAVAENVANFWKTNQTFKKSVETREGKPEYVFYEGPPSANGMPGIHHVMARALKDIFCRYFMYHLLVEFHYIKRHGCFRDAEFLLFFIYDNGTGQDISDSSVFFIDKRNNAAEKMQYRKRVYCPHEIP